MRRRWCSSIAAANAQIKAGKCARSPRFGGQARSPSLPDVPTLKELGYDVEFYLWVGLFAPKGTPDATIIAFWRDATRRRSRPSSSRRRSHNIGQDVAYIDQPEFKTFWDADAKRVEAAVQSIGKVEG